MKLFKKFTIALLLILQVQPLFAKELEKPEATKNDKGIFSVVWENDVLSGKDKGYTNGIRFAYISSEEQSPKFLRHASDYLPMFAKNGKKRIGIAVGQNIYTPSKSKPKLLIPKIILTLVRFMVLWVCFPIPEKLSIMWF